MAEVKAKNPGRVEWGKKLARMSKELKEKKTALNTLERKLELESLFSQKNKNQYVYIYIYICDIVREAYIFFRLFLY